MDILEKVLVFDGAMGTLLQEEGLKPGDCPEWMNVAYPEKVEKIHHQYLQSGADVITTNTFGGNQIKLKEYGLENQVEEINRKGVETARKAIGNSKAYVAASVGPTGQFVVPIGKVHFNEMYEIFKEQIEALSKEKPDFILLETFNDLGEIRAALLAAKDVCDIPVICSLTYEGGRTLTGVSPKASAVVLESLGASAIGANCSGGPKELFEVIKEIGENTTLPLIVQPNAGLPQLREGKVYYPLDPTDFMKAMEPYFTIGMNIFGSCCGSTPAHTKALKNRLRNFKILPRNIKKGSTLSSRERVIRIGENQLPKLVGERINPTAQKKLGEDLKKGEFSLLQREAILQIEKGAHLLDVNVGTPGIDEKTTMYEAINLLQQNVTAPLVLDSTDPKVLELALQGYHGKALVNSVNGEEKSLNTILPLVKRYGAGVIALALDERGIPESIEERYEIAKKIVQKCMEYGISKKNIYIDPLALSLGTDDHAAKNTLKALSKIKEELKVNTILGVSNISHGLPSRRKINGAFFAMAIGNGLDLGIINPLDENMMEVWEGASFLSGRDVKGENYIQRNRKEKKILRKKEIQEDISIENVKNSVVIGSHGVLSIVENLIKEGVSPVEIINKGLIEGLKMVGEKFEEGEYFLPQLMLSGEITEKVFAFLEKYIGEDKQLRNKGTIVMGTVKGDVHDIGKNMVCVMLRSHGFNVIDLGKNVSPEEFLKTSIKENADIIGLSALMTTTMVEIPKTVEYVKQKLPQIKIIAGGAVVTKEYAKESGADGYSEDAVGAVKLVEKLLKI